MSATNLTTIATVFTLSLAACDPAGADSAVYAGFLPGGMVGAEDDPEGIPEDEQQPSDETTGPRLDLGSTEGPGETGETTTGDTGGAESEPPTDDPPAEQGQPEGPGECPIGSLDCPCTGGGSCDPGLACDGGVCLAVCDGAGYSCADHADCAGGLVCDAGVCGEPCGLDGCSCDSVDACDPGLVCDGAVCTPCGAVHLVDAGGLAFYTAPAVGAMSNAAVLDACDSCGMLTPCGNTLDPNNPGDYWQQHPMFDDQCVQVAPPETSVNPWLALAILACGGSALDCVPLRDVFHYAGPAGAQTGAKAITWINGLGSRWCDGVAGCYGHPGQFTSERALCAVQL